MAKGGNAVENPIIGRARNHFRALARVIEVPEWGDDEQALAVHVSPVTMNEKKMLAKKAENDEFGTVIDTIIMKSADEAGDPLFSKEDKHALMHGVDPDVVLRVFNEIMHTPTLEEAAGN